MSIIKILVKAIFQITGCIIAVLKEITDSLTKLFTKLIEHCETLHRKVDDMFEKKKKAIDVPL